MVKAIAQVLEYPARIKRFTIDPYAGLGISALALRPDLSPIPFFRVYRPKTGKKVFEIRQTEVKGWKEAWRVVAVEGKREAWEGKEVYRCGSLAKAKAYCRANLYRSYDRG